MTTFRCKCGKKELVREEEFIYQCECGITVTRYFDAKKDDYVIEFEEEVK